MGNNISRHFRCTQDNFKLSQVVPVVVTKIDTLIDLGEDECLEFSFKRAQSRTCSGYAERSRKCQRNLHEFFALQFNGDLVGRTNFHESNDGAAACRF